MARMVQPESKRLETLSQIKHEFRNHSSEDSDSRVEELLKKANSSLGFLKMITPRSRRSESSTGHTKITFGGDGSNKSRAGAKNVVSNWTGSNMDPDSVSRHYQGLKRAGFSDNRSVVGDLF